MKLISVTALLVLPFLAVATPTPTNAPLKRNNPTPTTVTVTETATTTAISVSQCNVGSLQCCDSTQSTSNPITAILLGLLGFVLEGVTTTVGLTCSPLTIIGASGTDCSAQPVCCENNSFNGVIAVGCTPINVNL